jgi:hypothetical protein
VRAVGRFSACAAILLCYCASSCGAEPPAPPGPECAGDCYIVTAVSADYRNVSDSYARSTLARVEDILYANLAQDKMDRWYFFGTMGAPYTGGTPLTLICRLVRIEDKATLLVAIRDSRTQEVYLDTECASSFFAPNDLFRAFAESFAEECCLPVRRALMYTPLNEGYTARVGTLLLDDIRYPGGTLVGDFRDFGEDLGRTADLPKRTLCRFNNFRTRKSIEAATLYGSSLMLLGEGIYFASGGRTGPTFRSAAASTMMLGLLSSFLVVIDWPWGLMKELNDWKSSRG